MSSSRKQTGQRQRLAQVAATMIVEQGIRDFRTAKHKAAAHLGVDPRNTSLPKNREIEAAVAEYQRLFGGDSQPECLDRMRAAALSAMRLFEAFQPRLVGEVLSGLAGQHARVSLHVFADQDEHFDLFLQDQGIPYEIVERRFRFAGGHYRYYPTFCFLAGDHAFEASVFATADLRQAPLSLVDGTPMARATAADVAALRRQSVAAEPD